MRSVIFTDAYFSIPEGRRTIKAVADAMCSAWETSMIRKEAARLSLEFDDAIELRYKVFRDRYSDIPAGRRTAHRLAKELGCSVSCVRYRAKKLGLKLDRGNGRDRQYIVIPTAVRG